MKKAITLFLILILVLSITACESGESKLPIEADTFTIIAKDVDDLGDMKHKVELTNKQVLQLEKLLQVDKWQSEIPKEIMETGFLGGFTLISETQRMSIFKYDEEYSIIFVNQTDDNGGYQKWIYYAPVQVSQDYEEFIKSIFGE